MNIEWIYKDDQSGAVTIYRNNICLNKQASTFFADAYAVAVGIERGTGNLIIKHVTKEEASSQSIDKNALFKLQLKTSYGRINGKRIVDFISDHFDLDFDSQQAFKCGARWNTGSKMLVIELGGGKQNV